MKVHGEIWKFSLLGLSECKGSSKQMVTEIVPEGPLTLHFEEEPFHRIIIDLLLYPRGAIFMMQKAYSDHNFFGKTFLPQRRLRQV